jgi:hypothetical protein
MDAFEVDVFNVTDTELAYVPPSGVITGVATVGRTIDKLNVTVFSTPPAFAVTVTG